tara:strand:+ start:119 stop:409 length:291 start_codon:yes stop_codon:yes gene_type:complete
MDSQDFKILIPILCIFYGGAILIGNDFFITDEVAFQLWFVVGGIAIWGLISFISALNFEKKSAEENAKHYRNENMYLENEVKALTAKKKKRRKKRR